MKIITWNCQGAFRKKADLILAHQPDILVVQECEHPEKLLFNATTKKPSDFYWHGDNTHKGIGIFSYSDFKFKLLKIFKPEFRYVLPFRVTGRGQSFTFFAIWAMDNKVNRKTRYIGQVWLAINHYAKFLDNSTLLIGDFNSNKIWDHEDRVASHTDVVEKLAGKNIFSVYHKHLEQEQGKENHPTFFLYRNKSKPYHLDYCFASSNLIDKIESVEVGSYDQWGTHSDHLPLSMTFKL